MKTLFVCDVCGAVLKMKATLNTVKKGIYSPKGFQNFSTLKKTGTLIGLR